MVEVSAGVGDDAEVGESLEELAGEVGALAIGQDDLGALEGGYKRIFRGERVRVDGDVRDLPQPGDVWIGRKSVELIVNDYSTGNRISSSEQA